MLKLRSMKVLGTLALIGVLSACSDSTEPEAGPQTLAIVSGNAQTGPVDQALADPLVVRITQDGAAVSGTSVSWGVTAGDGSANPGTSVTDAAGQTSTTWTVGSAEGANTLEASAGGVTGSPVVFTATGTGPPSLAAAVSVRDNSFNPSSSILAVGGTVTWTWEGSVDHTVNFESGSNSPRQTAGTFSRTFPSAGSFGYVCLIHGTSMSGTIVVQ